MIIQNSAQFRAPKYFSFVGREKRARDACFENFIHIRGLGTYGVRGWPTNGRITICEKRNISWVYRSGRKTRISNISSKLENPFLQI